MFCAVLQHSNQQHVHAEAAAAAAAASGCQSDDVYRDVTDRRLSCQAFLDNVGPIFYVALSHHGYCDRNCF